MASADRFLWATKVLDVQPTDRLLEIGCGAGLLAEQILLKGIGKLTAVDRSSAMINMAVKRNKRFIENGRADFITSDFKKTSFEAAAFDKIAAFNVNVFWKEPSKELALIRKYLVAGGRLYLFYQAPYESSKKDAQPVVTQLEKHTFSVSHILLEKLKPTSAFCVISRPG